MPTKNFKIEADGIERLIPNLGFCIASDRILVDGRPLGVMYRDPPQEEGDSGWVFMAGDESQAYLDEPNNAGLYEVNTVANYARDAIGFLMYPEGTRVERRSGSLVVVEGPEQPPSARLLTAAAPGQVRLTANWSATFAQRMFRRVEDGELVLWRPGLTVFVAAFSVDGNLAPKEHVADFMEQASPARTDTEHRVAGDLHGVRYRLEESSEAGSQSSINGMCVAGPDQLIVGIYFDAPEDGSEAVALFDSISWTAG